MDKTSSRGCFNRATSTPSTMCRVIFKGDYHIDLLVYHKQNDHADNEKHHLAVKDIDWEKSDPKEFGDWLLNKRDQNGQLVRIISYLKAWCGSNL